MIPEEILLKFGAKEFCFSKGEVIFTQGDRADYYYQIKSGRVILSTMNEGGKQFAQGVFSENESFGDPLLFIEKPYPSTAVALNDTVLFKLFKIEFFELLKKFPEFLFNLTTKLCELIYFKSKMVSVISLQDPEHRILTLFNYFKTQEGPEKIELTRQQIANLTGLRVETVIRTIKAIEEKGKLSIRNRKVYI